MTIAVGWFYTIWKKKWKNLEYYEITHNSLTLHSNDYLLTDVFSEKNILNLFGIDLSGIKLKSEAHFTNKGSTIAQNS